MKNREQPHKDSGEASYTPGTIVTILEYVYGDREGTIVTRTDNDGPDSTNWYEYQVNVPSLGRDLYFTEFELRRGSR